jgi:membrane associated rhomboid family serine protease/Zn-finger nucleic acid-binding protein
MRTCPRCSYYLIPLTYDAVQIDHCHRCGGTWLDDGEGRALIGVAADPAHWDSSGAVRDKVSTQMPCPVDLSPLERVSFSHGADKIDIERCTRCQGLWLDRVEALKLREVVMSAHQDQDVNEPGFWSFLFQAVSGTPIEVWNPTRSRPWATYAVMGLLILIYAYEVTLMGGDDAGLRHLIADLGYTPTRALAQPWTLITYALLHGGILHLLGNLYFLHVFGDNIEDSLGKRALLLFFVVTAAAGALAQHLIDMDTPVVGASGAIAGLMGAYVVLFPRVKVYVVLMMARLKIPVLWYMGIWIALQFLIALQQDSPVAWMVHLGGFTAGALMALLYRRQGLDAFVLAHTKSLVERKLSVSRGLSAASPPRRP